MNSDTILAGSDLSPPHTRSAQSRRRGMLSGCFRLFMVAAVSGALYAIATIAAFAQQWPTHPVRFVLPFGAGSGADTGARLISDKLQQKWGQPVIIDGRPGGDGLLSVGTVISAKDDHTF